MNSWAPLWDGLVDSSIWEEPDHVFRVFMAMLSLKDANHVVTMDGYKLAKRIHMPPEKVEEALKILESPDRRRPGQEFEGARIKRLEDRMGWEILNGQYYRDMVKKEMRRRSNAKAQAAWRERQKVKKGPLPGENTYVKTYENEGPEAADKLIDGEALARAMIRQEDKLVADQIVEAVTETPTQKAEREYRERRQKGGPGSSGLDGYSGPVTSDPTRTAAASQTESAS